MESEAWKGFRDTGRMQFAEFGTPLPLVQGVGKLLLGVTGLGQGMPHHLKTTFKQPPLLSWPLAHRIFRASVCMRSRGLLF